MIGHLINLSILVIFTFSLGACSSQTELIKQELASNNTASCYVIYDAGSSGTRLYIYEKNATNWLEHEGPKVAALADPVREILGKTIEDIDAIATEVVSALDDIKQNGPLGDNGKPKWQAFDWSMQCQLVSAKVFATAGMRIAEQENRSASADLWKKLKQKLQAKVGPSVEVSTRTLSGFEEGLYAWLTVREKKQHHNFGIVEMGGASSQITFPCSGCIPDDKTKMIQVEENLLPIYSYSFLGLGQDEASKTIGLSRTCQHGIGTVKLDWQENDCANCISIVDTQGIYDPYNYSGMVRGTHNRLPGHEKDVPNWFLTGAFNYAEEGEVESCCAKGEKCYKQEASCFRAVYLKKYLKVLNVPAAAEKVDASWTKGAVLCGVDNCLSQTTPPICRWSAEGCL